MNIHTVRSQKNEGKSGKSDFFLNTVLQNVLHILVSKNEKVQIVKINNFLGLSKCYLPQEYKHKDRKNI